MFKNKEVENNRRNFGGEKTPNFFQSGIKIVPSGWAANTEK